MDERNDNELLLEYTLRNSEPAFDALVSRHINLVYSAALRHVGNPHQAEEITQAVFIILAKKSRSLSPKTVLSGWLYQATRLTAANFRKSEIRRQRREQEAHMHSVLNETEIDAWAQIAPALDDAMAGLGEKDRNAVVLRFFENKNLRDVGAELGVTEDAAKMRVTRALEKLRKFFVKRGVVLSAMAIGGAMAANSVQAVPVGLAATVVATAAKGSVVATSTLTLVKGALKIMAWAKAKTAIAVSASVLLVAGTATVAVNEIREHDGDLQRQVWDIVSTNKWDYLQDNAELQMLIDIGPKALPPLLELIERDKSASHRKAVQIVYELGPAATRPATRALCGVLGNSSNREETTYALRALYWSIPESPIAVAALTNWLSDPTQGHLFGSVDGWELYPQLPETVPLLMRCLKNPHLVHEAANGLGKIGTNAAAAIPLLIAVCDRGVAEPAISPQYEIGYLSSDEPWVINRCAAYESLGKIGVASPETLTALQRGIRDTNEDIRLAALRSWARLGQSFAGQLTPTLDAFSARSSIKFQRLIEWVGTLGEDGRQALPWLKRLAGREDIKKPPVDINVHTDDYAVEADDIKLSAILAICRIEPKEMHQHLPDLLAQFDRRWDVVEILASSKWSLPEIVAGLEPMLSATNRQSSAKAAFTILALKPDHDRALEALRNGVAHGALDARLFAARSLWMRTGETNDVLRLCMEGLKAPESHIGQIASGTLENMGAEARPTIAALKNALWHKDRYVRGRAGKALRKIAPEEMPPVH